MARYDVIDGKTSTGLVLNNDSMYVSAGGTATETTLNEGGSMYVSAGGFVTETTLNEGGSMYVSSGGAANNTTVNHYGTINVSSGGTANITVVRDGYFNLSGTANSTTIADGGYLYVYPGGTANKVAIESGDLSVYRGGTATEIEWTPCVGSVTVENGAHVTFASEHAGVYYGSDGQLIESTTEPMNDRKLNDERQSMYVMSDGIANRTVVYFSGCQHVCSGGTVNSTWVRAEGNLLVSSGGTASDTTLDAYSNMAVFSGGAANNTIVNSGTFNLSGGVADGVTLNANGGLLIEDGGKADNVAIKPQGTLVVSSGSANVTEWTPGKGNVMLYGDAQVTFASEYSGVYYGDGENLISSAAEMNDAYLDANYYELYVMNGGTVNRAGVDGGCMAVFSGGAADVVNVAAGGKLFVNNGGKAEHATIGEWGEVYVNSGGTANKTVVNNYGSFTVFGSADDVTVKSSGTVWVLDSGKATNAMVNDCGDMVVSGATADITTVNFGGRLFIDETGKADHTTVFVAGTMYVSGSAENTTISGGDVEVRSGGTMTKTKVTTGDTDDYWGSATVFSGGTAINTTVDFHGGFSIHDGGSADIATVAAGGRIYIREGATVTNITAVDGARLGLAVAPGTYAQGTYAGSAFETKDGAISGYTVHSYGGLDVVNGGVATDITVTERAQVWVADGVLDGITMNGGYMYIANGGKVTGKMRFNGGDGDFISAYYGATVDFDLTRIAPGDEALVNDIFAITGYGTFTLTVDGMEKNGVYNLAGNAAYFEKTFTVMNTDGGKLGELKVNGEAQTFDDITYQLAVDGSNLTLTVSGAPDLTGDLNTAFTLTDGMYAKKVNVNDGGELEVFGTARKTVINKNGMVYVSAGGLVEDVIVNEGGFLGNHYGVVRGATVSGGEMNVGGQAYDTVVEKDGTVRAYNVLSNTTINAGGCVFAMQGATYNTTVNKGGELVVHAEARDMTVNQGGRLAVSAGGRITGKMTFEEGAFVVVESGATVDFDLTQAAPGEEALLNDLSRITGTPSYRILITGDETEGTYNLAGGAAGFDKTITVYDITISSLSIPRPFVTVGGESVEIGGKKYTLALDDSLLTLTVGDATPPNGPEEPLNDYLYDKKKTPAVNADVTEAYGTHLTEAGQEVWLDQNGRIDHDGYHNRIEKAVKGETRDTADYAKIVLEHSAKLSFHAEATAAATFTVYNLIYNEKKDTYSLKKLQTLKLADKDKDGVFSADSKKLLSLSVSGAYYVSMQFTDKKAEEAYYNVTLNDGARPKTQASVFYPLGNNSDDWGDKKTAGWGGAIDNRGTVTAATDLVTGEWVGFGDKTDYKKFTLDSAAELDFVFSASNGHSPVKFTIGKLKKTEKASGTTYSLVTIKSKTVAANKPSAELNALRLEAGEYYIKAESTNVKKDTGYDIQITRGDFYTDGDDGWNNVLLDGKKLNENAAYFYDNKLAGSGAIHFDKAGNDKYSDDYAEFTYNDKPYGGFVGFGDEIDFAKLTLMETSDVTFTLNATNSATLEIIKVTKNGEKYSKKSMQTIKYKQGSEDPATSKKAVTLEVKDGVSYYVSVKATNIKKTTVNPRTYYDVTYAVASEEESALSMPETASVASALAMPEMDSLADSFSMTDSLSLGRYDADVLTGASVADLTDLDDKSAWLNIASLA